MGNLWEMISGGFGQVAEFIGKGAAEVVKFGVKTNPEATVKVIKDTEETLKPIKEAGETVTQTIGGAWDGITGAIETVKKYALPAVAIGAVGYILLNRR